MTRGRVNVGGLRCGFPVDSVYWTGRIICVDCGLIVMMRGVGKWNTRGLIYLILID